MTKRVVRLTEKERREAIAKARASGVEWSDDVVLELAEQDKRDRLEAEEKSEVGTLKARVAALEKILGRDGQRLIDCMAHAMGQTLPKFVEQQLSKRMVMRDAGVYQPDRTYRPGEFVSHGGSGWVCKAPTRERPGSDPTSWRLAIKRGRDAQ